MTETTSRILLDNTGLLIIETTKSLVEIKKDIKVAKIIQKCAKSDYPIDINYMINLLEFRLLISLLMLDFATVMRSYLNSKFQYEALFSARQIIVIIYEGYKKIYNFLNPNKDGEPLKYRHNSFWIKNIGPIIKKDFAFLQNEYDSITESLDKYLKINFALVRNQRNLSIHYDDNPIKVYEMLLKLDIEDTFKKLIPFLNIMINMSILSRKISTLYRIKADSLNRKQMQKMELIHEKIEKLKNNKNKELLDSVQQSFNQIMALYVKVGQTL